MDAMIAAAPAGVTDVVAVVPRADRLTTTATSAALGAVGPLTALGMTAGEGTLAHEHTPTAVISVPGVLPRVDPTSLPITVHVHEVPGEESTFKKRKPRMDVVFGSTDIHEKRKMQTDGQTKRGTDRPQGPCRSLRPRVPQAPRGGPPLPPPIQKGTPRHRGPVPACAYPRVGPRPVTGPGSRGPREKLPGTQELSRGASRAQRTSMSAWLRGTRQATCDPVMRPPP